MAPTQNEANHVFFHLWMLVLTFDFSYVYVSFGIHDKFKELVQIQERAFHGEGLQKKEDRTK